jgi:ribosomal protein S25
LPKFFCLEPTPQKNKIKATSILNFSKLEVSKASQKLSPKSPQKLSKQSPKQKIKKIVPKIDPITTKSITRKIIKPKVITPNIITPKIIIPNIMAQKIINPNLIAQKITTPKVAPKIVQKRAPKIAQTIVKHH